MNKVDELIRELCPDGVERIKIVEVCSKVLAGGDRPSDVIKGEKYPTDDRPYPVYSNGKGEEALYGYSSTKRVDDKAVTVSARGTIGYHTVREPGFTPIVRLITLIPNQDKISADYLNAALYASDVLGTQGGIPQLTVPMMKEALIPLLPLEVQEEIVRILDQFVQLDRELRKEIAGREKQFAAIRDTYLESGWETMRLGDLVEYSRTRVKSENLNPHNYTGVENLLQDFEGRMPGDKLPPTNSVVSYRPGDVLLGNIRPYLKKAWLADSDGGASNDVLVLTIQHDSKSGLIPAWLYQVITGSRFLHYNVSNSKGAKMPRGDKKMILDYQIPLPPLEVQEEIATKLDTFTEYIENLKRERDLRQKQYEYYRDQLLDFPVKE